mmetsp:Transcript_13524/g.37179  ORF Transcript_13524/g.37179 Transcript_13524/m.37179 type:complete len:341 (+) Transcript_13524:1018-2040(+)
MLHNLAVVPVEEERGLLVPHVGVRRVPRAPAEEGRDPDLALGPLLAHLGHVLAGARGEEHEEAGEALEVRVALHSLPHRMDQQLATLVETHASVVGPVGLQVLLELLEAQVDAVPRLPLAIREGPPLEVDPEVGAEGPEAEVPVPAERHLVRPLKHRPLGGRLPVGPILERGVDLHVRDRGVGAPAVQEEHLHLAVLAEEGALREGELHVDRRRLRQQALELLGLRSRGQAPLSNGEVHGQGLQRAPEGAVRLQLGLDLRLLLRSLLLGLLELLLSLLLLLLLPVAALVGDPPHVLLRVLEVVKVHARPRASKLTGGIDTARSPQSRQRAGTKVTWATRA